VVPVFVPLFPLLFVVIGSAMLSYSFTRDHTKAEAFVFHPEGTCHSP
jgi:hypothetical protein